MQPELTKLRRWLILLNVSISVFMATLDGSIVNIALPVISKALSVNISSIQWVVTAYLLTISVLLLIWGKISDLYGKKKIFAFGFIIFTIGSGLCGLSHNLTMLVLSRVIQAIGASSFMALSQGIITSVFPLNERGKALGINGTTVAIGSLVGPSLGGVLVHTIGWQSIFFINIPIGILGAALTFILIPQLHEPPEYMEFDYKGSAMFSASLLLMFLGLLFLQEGSLSVNLFTFMFTASIILMFFFIRFEKKTNHPLIEMKLFKNRIFSFGLTSAFLSFISLNATILFIPFYLQLVLNLNTLTAGLLMSAYPATSAILSPISGSLSDRFSYRPLTVFGLLLNTVTLLKISTFNLHTSHLEIIIFMSLMGMSISFFQSPNTSSIMNSVPRNQLGIAGGINALFRNLGFVSGATLSVLIFSFTAKMNINNLSGSPSFNTELFLKGYKIVILFAALSCFMGAMINVTRVVTSNQKK